MPTQFDRAQDARRAARRSRRASRPDLFDPALHVRKWRGGFADTIWIQTTRAAIDLVTVARELRTLALARFVRRILIGAGDHPNAVAALFPLPSLRELVVGDVSRALPMLRMNTADTTAALDVFLDQLELSSIATRACERSRSTRSSSRDGSNSLAQLPPNVWVR